MNDYVPDKFERYGNGLDEEEFDFSIGHEPELSQEEFSELLEGYQEEIADLKGTLSTVCANSGWPDDPDQDYDFSWLLSALAERGYVYMPDPDDPAWHVQR